jgi:Bacterial protein of unknown function (Gcw_chp)
MIAEEPMKQRMIGTCLLLLTSASPVVAAELNTGVSPYPAETLWDVAFGTAMMSDYNLRGITMSNHKPSAAAYVEPRYTLSREWELYGGLGSEGISFPNRADVEIDFYGGIRRKFGSLAFDVGNSFYYFPGGTTYTGIFPSCTNFASATPASCNSDKGNMSFWEAYAKGKYALNDYAAFGANVFYSPSWLHSGAFGLYRSATFTLTAPASWFPKNAGAYLSGEFGWYHFGTTDAFYGIPGTVYANGIPYPAYTTWNIGLALTYTALTFDLRYYNTNLTKANCNVLTADHTATFATTNITPTNPGGLGSNWCSAAFIAKISTDLTINTRPK